MFRAPRRAIAGLAVAAAALLPAGCGTPDQTVTAQEESASAASASAAAQSAAEASAAKASEAEASGAEASGAEASGAEPSASPSSGSAPPSVPASTPASTSAPTSGSDSSGASATGSGAAPAPSPQPSDGVLVTGEVPAELRLTLGDLAALAQQTVDVGDEAAAGPAGPAQTGPRLSDVLDQAGLRTDPATPGEVLDLAVVVIGATGQQAVLSFGEISPDYSSQPPILSLAENGVAISGGPRLVVPGDVHDGRYVPGVVELRVVRVG